MRTSPMPRVCSGLLFSFTLVVVGCSNPSSQSLASLAITATPSTLSVGGASVMKATAHLSDGTTQDVTSGTQFTLSNSTLATMSNGSLTAKAAGTVTIQAAYIALAPAGSSPAAATTTPQTLNATTQVTITAAGTSNVPAIVWSAPAAITYGTALSSTQLNATADVPGTFTYTPEAGTLLKAGTQTLSATFTPTDKTYSAATASVQMMVSQATPVIAWTVPTSISTGTALSATQLNATSNVPGTFLYNPVIGTVLSAGSQPLTAVFSPTDTTDYTSATAQTSITVSSPTVPPVNPPTNPPTIPPTNPVGGPVLPTPIGCGGPTVTLDSGMSQSALQSAISNAPNCSLILFTAGTYSLTSKLVIPCKNLQITGPVASVPTAILAASFQTDAIFNYAGGCGNVGSVYYLHFENTGAIYVAQGNNSNLTVAYNLVTNLPSAVTRAGGIYSTIESGVFLDGSSTDTTSNVLIEYNTFGDANSCAAAFATIVDEGGSCAGVLTHTGNLKNLTINYNKFLHVEEGIHILEQIPWTRGGRTSVCISCVMDYNYVANYHRIGVEVQISTPTNPVMFEHNSIVDPVNSSWGTYALSFACCEWAYDTVTPGNSPGLVANDNVLVSTLPIGTGGWPPPFAIEFWGNGSIGENNWIGGTFSNGYVWGYGAGTWQINDNYICGPNMSKTSLGNAYILNEESTKNPPSQSGNVTSVSCSAKASTAPVISPGSSSFSGSQTITLSDSGANTGIWYTTDGSTPVPGSGTAQYYTGPFSISANTMVNAVGMWGNANQPTSYPAGYGYVPSGVVTATFVSSSVVPARALTSE